MVVLEDLVAVIADHTWAARRGLEALQVTWNEGPNAQVSSDLIWARLREASRRPGAIARQVGKLTAAQDVRADGKEFNAEFEMPLLAHACMEPLNCTVHVRPDSAEVWIGTQVIQRVRAVVAQANVDRIGHAA